MTLLEDSGYLARGATLVDRPLAYLGLHGRSFVPMLSGFACAIPAVFAARAIPARRERLLTIWILPLMSCSARLPVYALLLAALLQGAAWQAGLSLAAIYISSLLSGLIDCRPGFAHVFEISQSIAAGNGTAGLSLPAVDSDFAHDMGARFVISQARGRADSDRFGRVMGSSNFGYAPDRSLRHAEWRVLSPRRWGNRWSPF